MQKKMKAMKNIGPEKSIPLPVSSREHVRGGIKIKLEFCRIGEQLTLRGLTPK